MESLIKELRPTSACEALMNGMLAFLLFAGALHVDLAKLRSRAASVGLLATAGVIISTAIVGVSFWLVAGWPGASIPLIWSLVFGALISPTDPVAVLSRSLAEASRPCITLLFCFAAHRSRQQQASWLAGKPVVSKSISGIWIIGPPRFEEWS